MNEDQQAWIDGLRELAGWFEERPDLIPTWNAYDVQDFVYDGPEASAVEQLATAAKRMAPVTKSADDDFYFRVKRRFGPHSYQMIAPRDAVCERIVVGTEEGPESVVPAHTREIVEWECAPSLLKAVEA